MMKSFKMVISKQSQLLIDLLNLNNDDEKIQNGKLKAII